MKNKNRRPFGKVLLKRVLVLCEGESERIYVKGFCSEENQRRRLSSVEVEVYQPTNYSPYGLLQEARKKAKEAIKDGLLYDSVWIVFDKDNHANIKKTFSEARDTSIKIAFSAICFETWILLHFEQTAKPFLKCDKLVDYIKRKGYINYQKTNYYTALTDENKKNAFINASWLRIQNGVDIDAGKSLNLLDSYTDFDKLILYLRYLQ